MKPEWCKKYDVYTVDKLNMLLPKDLWITLVKTSNLIHQCLRCVHYKKDCNKSEELVELLSKNWQDLYS
jgi:hypothetical protein